MLPIYNRQPVAGPPSVNWYHLLAHPPPAPDAASESAHIPVYHWNGCGNLALELRRMPNRGDMLLAADIAYPSGRVVVVGDTLVCDSCGQMLVMWDLHHAIEQAREKHDAG